jgi:hypothetical protein
MGQYLCSSCLAQTNVRRGVTTIFFRQVQRTGSNPNPWQPLIQLKTKVRPLSYRSYLGWRPWAVQGIHSAGHFHTSRQRVVPPLFSLKNPIFKIKTANLLQLATLMLPDMCNKKVFLLFTGIIFSHAQWDIWHNNNNWHVMTGKRNFTQKQDYFKWIHNRELKYHD